MIFNFEFIFGRLLISEIANIYTIETDLDSPFINLIARIEFGFYHVNIYKNDATIISYLMFM